MSRPDWRQLRKEVRAAGGVEVRQGSTSHVKYRLPGGELVILQHKHLGRTVRPSVAGKVRAAIQRSGAC